MKQLNNKKLKFGCIPSLLNANGFRKEPHKSRWSNKELKLTIGIVSDIAGVAIYHTAYIESNQTSVGIESIHEDITFIKIIAGDAMDKRYVPYNDAYWLLLFWLRNNIGNPILPYANPKKI